MKRIPFTIEAWKAGGVPVTRSGEYVKQLTWFEGITGNYSLVGNRNDEITTWTDTGIYYSTSNVPHVNDLLLEVPCTKYYTHYYRTWDGEYLAELNQNPEFINNSPQLYTHIKTVEVEL